MTIQDANNFDGEKIKKALDNATGDDFASMKEAKAYIEFLESKLTQPQSNNIVYVPISGTVQRAVSDQTKEHATSSFSELIIPSDPIELACFALTVVLNYPDFDGDDENELRPICSLALRAINALESIRAR